MIPLFTAALAQTPAPVTTLPTNERLDAAALRCLLHWKDHPFGPQPSYRVLSPSVRVLGLGSRETTEELATATPELVIVDTSVSVLTKTTFTLANPNGWYCFAENVGVLSKIVFDAHCSANLADSRTGALVMGRSHTNGGVVVLGDVEVRRECPATP
jgi:hypothetical protein